MFGSVIPEGTEAPGFELPGLIDGAQRRIALDEFVGQDVVILAFYPADFNPACDVESDLDELDLFTMQKDVSVLAVGPDTLYSHAAFAEEYGLTIPLLSDTRHEVAETYDVAFEDDVGQRLVERAVVVIDHDGVVQYTWRTQEMEQLPPVEDIKDAIAETGGDDTAFARYRIGHAHYTEGRRTFTSAMKSYRNSEWMLAQSDFKRAREEFEEAADHFDTAVRFVDDEEFEGYYDRAQEKSTALWQAADWLSQSANKYSSGVGAEGQRLRDDAEGPLEAARALGEPTDPDDWPPDPEEDDEGTFLPQEESSDSALAVDVDDEVAAAESADGTDGRVDAEAETGDDAAAAGEPGSDGEDSIDDAELEEIEAELAASQPDNPEGEELEENPTSMVDAPPGQADAGPVGDGGGEVGDDPGESDDTPGESDGDGGEPDDAGEMDEPDLDALEAEMAASQSAAEEATARKREQAVQDDDGALDGPTADGDDAVEDRQNVGDDHPGSGDDGQDAVADQSGPNDDGQGLDDGGPGDPAADPHADLASGSGSVPSAAAGSLEPADGGDDSPDEDSPDEAALDEDEFDEPQGASDDDLADIPTTEDLNGDDEDGSDANEA